MRPRLLNRLSNFCATLDAGSVCCYISGVIGPARVSGVELDRFAVGAATNFGMDNDQHICQRDAGFRLCLVPARPIGSSCNLLSQSHMDTLHCSTDVAGSAAQFNRSVSAMPSYLSRTSETPLHPGTADALLLR
jgi:hypothetical protein